MYLNMRLKTAKTTSSYQTKQTLYVKIRRSSQIGEHHNVLLLISFLFGIQEFIVCFSF